ncbi:amino acid adenylation domain-containing protein [Nocardia sp. NPDC006630]|uniref:non-ribosomal peptide synthetase n=1 Tax=Nocardia sp. NPDC006630 TaxID=3157181 RepID=UPI0033BE31E2
MTVRRRRLTPMQSKLYTQQRLFPDDPSHNVGLLDKISGAVDPEQLRAALEQLFHEAEPFNEYFGEADGEYFAEYDPERRYHVELERRSGNIEAELAVQTAQRLDIPIAMDRWPQFAVRVLTDDAATYVEFIFNHMVADIATFYNIVADLKALYGDLEAGVPGGRITATHEAPAPDHVRAAIDFFRADLGALDTLAVSEWDAERGRDGRLPGVHATTDLGPELSASIDGAIYALGVRKFTFFTAAHLVLLSCLSGSTRVTTGIPLANRRRDRDLVRGYGYHVNTLPLSVDLADYMTFEELCQAVECRMERLIAFEDFDLTGNGGEIFAHSEAAMSRPSSVFTFYRRPLVLDLPGARVEVLDVPRDSLIAPVTIVVAETPQSYRYHVAVTPGIAVSSPAEVIRTVLRHLATDPGSRLTDIPWVSTAEHARTAEVFGPTEQFEISPSLAAAFEEQAAQTPDAVAIAYDGSFYTYAELNQRANRVAHWILEHFETDFVGISLHRSTDLITVLLGVLKAGKAYVPIDPAAPAQRVEAILSRFDTLPVIADQDALTDIAELQRWDLRKMLRRSTFASGENPAHDDLRQAPAYVIFTSGSTGTPKGVVVTQENVLRLFSSALRAMDFGVGDVWSLFHSYAFDFAVWEIFGALLHGGRLEIVPEWTRRSPADFAAFLAETQVTVLNQTPTAFRQLSQAMTPDQAATSALHTVIFGGEMLRFESLDRWIELFGSRTALINMYGITETTVHVTHHRITGEDLTTGRPSVIGRPLSDLKVTVVDTALRPVPFGVAGEMLISGPGVAVGYLGQPELTNQRFVETDFGPGKHYRSGDLARMDADGSLTYLGRMDRQVQLRGVRIELGEVEAALLTVAEVGECVVRLDEREPAEPELVAFLVESAPSTDSHLRFELRDRLPANMRPAKYVRLEQLPLTVNGKIDEARLPWPDTTAVVAELTEIEPSGRSSSVGAVRKIWAQVLGHNDFGDEDPFFDAGGTSVFQVRLLELLRADCAAPDRLEMVDLFEFTTVRTQADHLDRLAHRHAA